MNVSVNITCEPREECNSTVVVRPYSRRHIWYENNFIGSISELTTGGSTTGGSTTGTIIDVTNPVATLLVLGLVQTFNLLVDLPVQSDYNTVSTLQLKIELNCVSTHEPNFVEVEAEVREIWEGILQWVSMLTIVKHIIIACLWCMRVGPKPKPTPVQSTLISSLGRRVGGSVCSVVTLVMFLCSLYGQKVVNLLGIRMRSVCASRTLTICNSRRGFLWKKNEGAKVSSACEV